MFKILSWNIRQGGGSRIIKICSKLTTLNPSVIALSEYRNNASGQKIRQILLNAGYRYQSVTAAKSDVNSAALFSKLPYNSYLFPEADPEYSQNILCAEFEAFKIYSMYLPHKKKHVLFDFLLEDIKGPKPSILVGDFNTGKNYIDQVGNSFWYTDKIDALEKQEYIDAFRLIQKDIKEYSWYSHQGNGYRYDHSYVHNSLEPVIKECYYLHEWREDGLSDHSPMVLTLG